MESEVTHATIDRQGSDRHRRLARNRSGHLQGVGAREGAAVAVTDVLDDEGRAIAKHINSMGGQARFWHLDVTDEAAVEHVLGAVADAFGKIDVVVNNAGIAGVNKPTHETTIAEWEHVFKINVHGVFLCTKHAVPHLRRAGGGCIINLSSIFGMISMPYNASKLASKGAVRVMTQTDALLYAQDRIRVNSVHPGPVLVGDMVARRSPEDLEALRPKLESLIPLGHLGEPDDVAYGIVYLASDEAKFVTGSELVIDGGYTAR